MRKNEQLIGIRPYQTSTGDWHLELTYAYEDKKGEHRVIFPDVQCPFPTQDILFFLIRRLMQLASLFARVDLVDFRFRDWSIFL